MAQVLVQAPCDVPAAGAAAAEAQQQPAVEEPRTWWSVLASLKAEEDKALGPLLEHAHAAVAKDQQWCCSGVPGLLQRAVEQAKRGSFASARSLAATVLDFHSAASRYAAKQAPLAAGGASNKRKLGASDQQQQQQEPNSGNTSNSSSSTSSEVSSSVGRPHGGSATATAALDRLATLSSELHTPSSTSTGGQQQPSSNDSCFTMPEPPAKRRQTAQAQRRQQPSGRRSPDALLATAAAATTHVVKATPPRPKHEGRLHMPPPPLLSAAAAHPASPDASRAASPAAATAAAAVASKPAGSSGGHQAAEAASEWTGVLALLSEDGSRASDLCHATLQLPAHVAPLMPRALQLTHLVQRRGVMLGQYQVVRTAIKKANMRQMSRLRSMAQHELVAVAALDHMHVIVVPYADAKGALRLVSFVLGPQAAAHATPAPEHLQQQQQRREEADEAEAAAQMQAMQEGGEGGEDADADRQHDGDGQGSGSEGDATHAAVAAGSPSSA